MKRNSMLISVGLVLHPQRMRDDQRPAPIWLEARKRYPPRQGTVTLDAAGHFTSLEKPAELAALVLGGRAH